MKTGLLAAAALLTLAAVAHSVSAPSPATASTCFGTTADGALEDGCKLPSSGSNFSSYTVFGGLLGRTWVHCTVADVVKAAFAGLHSSNPGWRFVVGETGFEEGGRFKPHRTHQNGLSVDFMVPVVDRAGKSVPLPTGVTNKFGYDIEFDEKGVWDELSIDFEAMAAHIAALRDASEGAGVGVWRVIFDPRLQPRLRATASWASIRDLRFSERRSWVRHDEHYHVDFEIPCRPKAEFSD